MTQIQWAKNFMEVLVHAGLREVIVCAGARNAPLIEVLQHSKGLPIYSSFDERAASFFALGRAKRLQAPVAVVTTSGTAVAELFPAVIEAQYTKTPLWLITADRPLHFRNSGAPQTINQAHIFGDYVDQFYDLPAGSPIEIPSQLDGIHHFNLCFDEPLIDDNIAETVFSPQLERTMAIKSKSKTDFSKRALSPLFLISGLSIGEAAYVKEVFSETKYKDRVCFELTSRINVNGGPVPESLIDKWLAKGLFDCIVRIGGVPTHRAWRDLEDKYKELPVYVFSRTPLSGLSRSTAFQGDLTLLEAFLKAVSLRDLTENLAEQKRRLSDCISEGVRSFPQSEASAVRMISSLVAKEDFLYIGNSLPIRNFNDFSNFKETVSDVSANRGVNGIDGQISSFLGESKAGATNWAVIGDLTALYDLNALHLANHFKADDRELRIVIINNQGGQIFRKFSNSELYFNSHNYSFQKWAELFGWDYLHVAERLSSQPQEEFQKLFLESKSQRIIIEIGISSEQDAAFFKYYRDFCRSSL